MKIGILSDTHDHHRNVLAAIDIFNQHGVDHILHAGDIVSPFTAKAFAQAAGAKLIAVYGNNDGEKLRLQSDIREFGGQIHDNCFKGALAGKEIFMTHTHYFVEEAIASQKYDLVIYGHTHKPDLRRVDRTLVINPGETTDWITSDPHVAILNLDDMNCQHIPIE
jgi:putative phosphoesterase